MPKNNIELIGQALSAAESSIKLAKQLLAEMESGKPAAPAKEKVVELPGVTGIFDGENMVGEGGETFPVPANYASKSMLVVGDTLKLVEEGKDKRFKQIEHVKRHKTLGMLTKKDGKWKVITPEGSYKVLPAAVSHFGADVGSEVVLHLPANNLTVPYGAIESIKNEGEVAAKSAEKTEAPKAKTEKLPEKPKEEKTEKPIEVRTEKPKEPEEKSVEAAPVKSETKAETPAKVEENPVKEEAPKVEAPKVEAPKTEAPRVEAPKPEPPKVEETPKPEPPKEEPKATPAPAAQILSDEEELR